MTDYLSIIADAAGMAKGPVRDLIANSILHVSNEYGEEDFRLLRSARAETPNEYWDERKKMLKHLLGVRWLLFVIPDYQKSFKGHKEIQEKAIDELHSAIRRAGLDDKKYQIAFEIASVVRVWNEDRVSRGFEEILLP